MSLKPSSSERRAAVASAARKQKSLQAETRAADAARPAQKTKARSAPQISQRPELCNQCRMPAQHQDKPGLEYKLDPRPRFLAPDYKGSAKLANKVALITGGDSGIGRSVAVLFAREGAKVAIVYLNETRDAEETRRHVEQEGSECLLIEGDVSETRFCEDAVAQTLETFGKPRYLLAQYNAAFQLHAANIEDLSAEQFDLTMRTNVYGYFNMAKAVVPYLTHGSAIINTGSETGFFGSEELLDYSATKGAIHAFTRSLAKNLLPRGIRVNAVAPGPVWTPLNPSDRTAEEVSRFGADSEMKRPAQPEEISPAYVFLAAPVCSSYMTGTVLPLFGGAAPGG